MKIAETRTRVAPMLCALLCAAVVGACGSDTTAPSAPVPPPGVNNPPVISSLTSSSSRAEANAEVELTAVVQDQETSPASLTYSWAAAIGTFTGTGATVRWRAPVTVPTPLSVDLTLTVIEHFTSGKEAKENRVSATVPVHVNESNRDLSGLAMTFLDDFVHSDRPADFCVRNFSDSCRGKQDELSDIKNNRISYVNDPSLSSFSVRSIAFDTPGSVPTQATFATVLAPCTFAARPAGGGPLGYAVGTCRLTNVYENWQWRLCESRFDPPSSSSTSSLGAARVGNALQLFWRAGQRTRE